MSLKSELWISIDNNIMRLLPRMMMRMTQVKLNTIKLIQATTQQPKAGYANALLLHCFLSS